MPEHHARLGMARTELRRTNQRLKFDSDLATEPQKILVFPLESSVSSSPEKASSTDLTSLGGPCESVHSKHVMTNTIEADLVIEHLREARAQIVDASGVNVRSKKLLNALLSVVVEEFTTLPEDKNNFREPVSAKAHVVLFSLLSLLLVILAFLFSAPGNQHLYDGPTPT